MKITVFTPTYNRAHTLPHLYESLQKQTFQDFEWLIVDDGSIDNTENLVADWCCQENNFLIRYYKQTNGGKHRAINRGVALSKTELFFIVDSDDRLTEDALETILQQVDSIPSDMISQFAGVCGCRGYSESVLIGTTFDGQVIDCTSLNRSRHGITGDKAEVFFTHILKKYPFPEYEGEKFVTECVVWDTIAEAGYVLRYFNQIIYLCKYLEDGLTHQGLDLYYRNPQGYGHYLRMCRGNKKFTRGESAYYDAECYYHWKDTMSVNEIAELIGTNIIWLLVISYLTAFRKWLSKAKKRIFQ